MQSLIVAVLVALAGLYALWHFLPARWRRRVAARVGLRAEPAAACHGCDDCGACAASARSSSENRH